MLFATFMTPLHALAAGESDKPKVFFISDITPESLVKIYKALGVNAPAASAEGYDVFDVAGTQLLSHADSLDSLDPGIYFVNGVKTVIK